MRTIAAIINPASGAGQGLRVWKQLQPRLKTLCERLIYRFSSPGEDMSMLTRALLEDQPDCLVVVGGDGSLSQAVNALFADNKLQSEDLKVAYYNAGTGGDFARQFSMQKIDDFLDNVIHNRTVLCDVGKITFHVVAAQQSHDAVPLSEEDNIKAMRARLEEKKIAVETGGLSLDHEISPRYFINIASCGLSAHIAYRVSKSGVWKKIAGRFFYLWHSIVGLMQYRVTPMLIVPGGGEVKKRDVLLTAVCNGRFFGRNMNIAPHAHLDDGLLDIVTFGRMNRLLSIFKLRTLYKGTHLKDKHVHYQQVKLLTMNTLGNDIWVEADGDVVGQLPASFEILSGAFKVIV